MFKIVYPVQTNIYGSNFSEAIKNYVKVQNDVNLTNLIIQNNNLYQQAYINYIKKNGRKIAKINTFPLNPNYPLSYHLEKLGIDSLEDLKNRPIRPNAMLALPFIPLPRFLPPPVFSPYIAF
jgi:hypothetical protein